MNDNFWIQAFRKVIETTIAESNMLFFLHLDCRGKLESELKACTVEKQSTELKLASFEILGKEFEALAEEYSKLRQEIEVKNWALKELNMYNNK